MNIIVKSQFLKAKVAFGQSAKPLNERPQDELKQLVLEARLSNNKFLLNYFENPPTLQELQSEKTAKAILEIKQSILPTDSIPPKTEDTATEKK